MKVCWPVECCPNKRRGRQPWSIFSWLALVVTIAVTPWLVAQSAGLITIRGTVLDAGGHPVDGASVTLTASGSAQPIQASTDLAGAFIFSPLPVGNYQISAAKSGLRSAPATIDDSSLRRGADFHLTLGNAPDTPAQTMEFADQPSFTVAGVTDWTAAGGHGSDSTLRTSEDLARETAALKSNAIARNAEPHPAALAVDSDDTETKLRAALAGAPGSFDANHRLGAYYLQQKRFHEAAPFLQGAYQIDPQNRSNERDLAMADEQNGQPARAREHLQRMLARQDDAELHRLLAELDERSGDPLAAVHEDEQAVRLDPSEENYFAWGSELLLHRAVWQAVEVYRNGNKLHPGSARMLTALGTALFAGDLFEEAATKLCAASDLHPADAEPYSFMGRVAIAAPGPLPCVEPRLQRFAEQQPSNATANYLYAMAIWKRVEHAADAAALDRVQALLGKAVALDPNCAEAYLQLGILAASQHRSQEAISDYSKAIEADPQLGEAHYRLGVAYDRSGQAVKAQQEFQLHDQIEKSQAVAVERQRKEVKQFLVVLQGQPVSPSAH